MVGGFLRCCGVYYLVGFPSVLWGLLLGGGFSFSVMDLLLVISFFLRYGVSHRFVGFVHDCGVSYRIVEFHTWLWDLLPTGLSGFL